MLSKLILALAAIAALNVACYANGVPSSPGPIMKKLYHDDLTPDQVHEFLSQLPREFRVSPYSTGPEFMKLANFDYTDCSNRHVKYVVHMGEGAPGTVKSYCKFHQKKLVEFCNGNPDKMIEAFFASKEGKEVIDNVSKHHKDFDRFYEDPHSSTVKRHLVGYCKDTLKILDEYLAPFKVDAEKVADQLEKVSQLPAKEYLAGCRNIAIIERL